MTPTPATPDAPAPADPGDPGGEPAASEPARYSPAELAHAVELYRLPQADLDRLAAFAAAHPEIHGELGVRVRGHSRTLDPENPSRLIFDNLPFIRMQAVSEAVTSGRFDESFLNYVRDRMTSYDLDGTDPKWMWPWTAILPGLIAETARAAGYPKREVTELFDIAHRASVFVTVIMTDVFVTSRDRRLLEAKVNERFRSLVHSVQDVITVVSSDDTVTVMSPDTSILAPLNGDQPFARMRELLDDHQLELWAAADARLRRNGRAVTIQIETSSADGRLHAYQAKGTTLAGNEEQRVWVWQDITERVQLERELSHQAFHDPLTGIANRALLFDRVEHALAHSERTGHPVSLLFCDLDDFKSINDSLGHSLGDQLLVIVAQRLAACVRSSDTLARLGGDEFAVLLETADIKQATEVAQRIVDVVAHESHLADQTVLTSTSVGVTTATPGIQPEEFLRNADLAMYAAKKAGRSRVEIFRPELHFAAADRFNLSDELKHAVDKGQMHLHYQPTRRLSDGSWEGVEALIRWEHPTRGRIAPDTFIPMAEANGSIINIGKWVLQQACRDGARIQTMFDKQVRVHVNVAPQQLRNPEFRNHVTNALLSAGLDPSLLVLEITESTLIDDRVSVGRLHEIHDLGVRIAIDDFGTGYTSINYIQQLPIDIIKIDRSFISGKNQSNDRLAFLDAILGLARSLNLQTVAEGVETEAQLAELRTLGCESAQGYLWAPAVPIDELEALADKLERLDAG
ncbi:MAG: EAL domain-containing protein [Acidimicrobiia bacterium]|nr:EAL domain-containing protein [Acidimicrobiia bacterium]